MQLDQDALKLLRLARIYLNKRDDFKAVRILRKLIKEKRGEHFPAEWLAELYFDRRELKPALYYAQSALPHSDHQDKMNHIIGTAATACGKMKLVREAWAALDVQDSDWQDIYIGVEVQEANCKHVYRARMTSPCTAEISSVPFPGSTLNAGDEVLVDRASKGLAYDATESIDILPFLDRLKRHFLKVFSCRLEPCSLSEFRMLMYLCQKKKIYFDVWSNSTVHYLGSKKQKNPEIYLGLVNDQENSSHHVALAGQRKIEVLKVLQDWKGITHKNYYMLRKH